MSSRSRRATSCPECGRLAAARASPIEIYLIDAGFVIVVPLVFATARHRRPQAVREFDLLSRTYGAASSASAASPSPLHLPFPGPLPSRHAMITETLCTYIRCVISVILSCSGGGPRAGEPGLRGPSAWGEVGDRRGALPSLVS